MQRSEYIRSEYIRTYCGAMLSISLSCLGCLMVVVFLAWRAEIRAVQAVQRADLALERAFILQEQLESLRDDLRSLDQRCDAQYDQGWTDAEWENIDGDPPYSEWGC